MSVSQEGWLTAALDAIAQFRATKEPLKNVVKRLSAGRRLGPRERTKMSDAVFAWSRLQGSSEETLEALKQSGISRPTPRQIDEAIIRKWQSGEAGDATFPAWFIEKIRKQYGAEAESLLASLTTRAGPCLAVDVRYVSVEEVCAALEQLAVSYEHWAEFPQAICILADRFSIESLPAKIGRHVWPMDAASQLVAQMSVPPSGGTKVLDACAGGGGKTLFLLSRGAQVVAMDISQRRLSAAQKRLQREKISFVVGDATNPPFKPGTFDYILLDAPCSGTGTLRRAPDLLLRLSPGDLVKYANLQRELLRSMHKLLKSQGRLVYATCSLLEEENAAQAAFACKELQFKIVSERQLLPSRDNSDGFYVAILQKTGE